MKQKIEEMLEQEPLKEEGLNLIGIGADKVVFETPGSSKKIIKISKSFILQKIGLLLGISNKTEIDNNDESKVDEYQKKLIEEHNKIEEEISEVFGKEHLLRKGIFKAKIPFTKEMIHKLISNKNFFPSIEKLNDDTIYEVETLAETQSIAEELKDREKFKTKDFSIGLVTYDNFRKSGDILEAMSYVRDDTNSDFLSEFDKNSKDKKYVDVVKEIVTKIIQYTKKTGYMIDIFGPDNITIYNKEDGSLDYHLPDVILPGSQDYWRKNIKDDKNFDLLRHNYIYYYSIKSLADKLGISDNLNPEDLIYFKDTGIPTEGKFPLEEEQ